MDDKRQERGEGMINNGIERYHSQFNEFDKVRRGINQV